MRKRMKEEREERGRAWEKKEVLGWSSATRSR